MKSVADGARLRLRAHAAAATCAPPPAARRTHRAAGCAPCCGWSCGCSRAVLGQCATGHKRSRGVCKKTVRPARR